MKHQFRDFKIVRTCTEVHKDYHDFKKPLKKDFHQRCAYCNLRDDSISSSFEIDHFIPREKFEHTRDELDNDYNNLIYSCPKCNRAKGSQFEGDLTKKTIENELFYNPVDTDYNNIFYRDDLYKICSDDEKGRKMIQMLKLFRPIHSLAEICDRLKKIHDKLYVKQSSFPYESPQYEKIHNLYLEIKSLYCDCRDLFIANYNNNEFSLK